MTRLLLAAALAAMVPGAAMAQQMPCHDAAAIAKNLKDKYEEAPVAFGLQSNGNLLEVYSSDKKDTWTVVSTTPQGMSCIVAAGKKWNSLPPARACSAVTPEGEVIYFRCEGDLS